MMFNQINNKNELEESYESELEKKMNVVMMFFNI